MIQNFLYMNGYGLFVWAAFSITFISCGVVFYKTQNTLKKYEIEFAKQINDISHEKRKSVVTNSKVASQVLSAYRKTI